MPGPDFETVAADYYRPLYRFAFSLTCSETEACDLTQQAFYLWATQSRQLRDASKAKLWLLTTLHHAFQGRRGAQARFADTELREREVELPVVSPETARQVDARQAVEALGRMEERYRAPVALFYLEDCSWQEMAEILEEPIGSVKSRLARGLAQFQEILSGSAAGNNPTGERQ